MEKKARTSSITILLLAKDYAAPPSMLSSTQHSEFSHGLLVDSSRSRFGPESLLFMRFLPPCKNVLIESERNSLRLPMQQKAKLKLKI